MQDTDSNWRRGTGCRFTSSPAPELTPSPEPPTAGWGKDPGSAVASCRPSAAAAGPQTKPAQWPMCQCSRAIHMPDMSVTPADTPAHAGREHEVQTAPHLSRSQQHQLGWRGAMGSPPARDWSTR